MKTIVLKTFVDKKGVQHISGDVLNIEEPERVENLVNREIVKVAEGETIAKTATKKNTRKAAKNA